MNRKHIIQILLACATGVFPSAVSAQTVSWDALLDEMERNNTRLQVLREELAASRLENRTGLNLANPEVEFHYLWDTQGTKEARKDFSVVQAIDWATLTGQKRRLRKAQDGLLDLQYRQQCIAFRLEGKQALAEWAYSRAYAEELKVREQHAERLAESYAAALEKGNATVVEANKARLEHTLAQAARRKAEADVHSVEAVLQQLNGGNPLPLSVGIHLSDTLPGDFALWYEQAERNSPVLRYVKAQLDLEHRQVGLARSENWPSLTVGYMTERGPVEGYQGLSVGLSVPLWENKNKVKQRKAAVKVAESRDKDVRLQFYSQVNMLYNRARELEKLVADYRKAIDRDNPVQMLGKALAAGQLTLTDYYKELSLFYEAADRLLETEREYRLVVAELQSWQW